MFSPNQNQRNRSGGEPSDFSFSPHSNHLPPPSPPPTSFPSSPLSPTPAMSHSLNSLIQRDAHNYSPDFSKDVLQPMQGGAPVRSPPGSCSLPPLRSVVGEFLPQPSLGLDVDMGGGESSSSVVASGNGQSFQGSPLKRPAQTGLTSPLPQFTPSPMSPFGFPTSPQQQHQMRQQQQQQYQQVHSPFRLPQGEPYPMSMPSSVSQSLSYRSPTSGEVTSPLQGLRSPTSSPFDPNNALSSGSSSRMNGSGSPFGSSSGFGPPQGFPSSKHPRALDRRASFSDPGSTMEMPMGGHGEKGMVEPKKGRHCWVCGVSKTPRWRRGPDNRQLCNSCGLRYIRKKKKEIERKAPDTSTSPSSMNFD